MRLIWFIFGLLLVLLGLCITAFFLPSGQTGTMSLHELNPEGTVTLLKSTTNGLTPPVRFWGGAVAGLVMIAIMGAMILLGWRRKHETTAHLPWLISGVIGYALLFIGMWSSYASYTETGSAALIGGYPAPTAWMIYGIWIWPLLMVIVMIRRFDQWFMDPTDIERLKELARLNEANQQEA